MERRQFFQYIVLGQLDIHFFLKKGEKEKHTFNQHFGTLG